MRTFEKHKKKSFPNTFCIPIQKFDKSVGVLEKFREKNIIVYSRIGNRLKTVTKILNENGFSVYNIIVEINNWERKIRFSNAIIKNLKN